jgi:hypothetical protein
MRVALLSAKEDRPPSIRAVCCARGQHRGAMGASSPDAPQPDGARDPSRPVLQTGAGRTGRVGRTLQRRRGDRHLGGFARVGGGQRPRVRSPRACRERRRRTQRHGPQHRFGGRETGEPPHRRRTPGRGGSSAQARHSPSKPAGDALRDGPKGRSSLLTRCATPRRKHHAIGPVDRVAPGLSSLAPAFAQSGRAPAGTRHPLPGFRGARPPMGHAGTKRLARRVDRTAPVRANLAGATVGRPGAAGAPP